MITIIANAVMLCHEHEVAERQKNVLFDAKWDVFYIYWNTDDIIRTLMTLIKQIYTACLDKSGD